MIGREKKSVHRFGEIDEKGNLQENPAGSF